MAKVFLFSKMATRFPSMQYLSLESFWNNKLQMGGFPSSDSCVCDTVYHLGLLADPTVMIIDVASDLHHEVFHYSASEEE